MSRTAHRHRSDLDNDNSLDLDQLTTSAPLTATFVLADALGQ